MTNPAEKIRQVVEENKKRFSYLYNNAMDSNNHDGLDADLVTFWHQELTVRLLDAIIDSLNEVTMQCWNTEIALREAGLEMQERATATKREHYIEVIQMLEEARSSLDGGGKSITNSTHE